MLQQYCHLLNVVRDGQRYWKSTLPSSSSLKTRLADPSRIIFYTTGSAFDELELNRILCQHYNVRIAGVIINKVRPDKYEQTNHYMSKAMMQAWGIPLLGCVPDRAFLGCPALADLEALFGTKLISGHENRFRHYNVGDMTVVTTSLTRFLENLRQKERRSLYVCHITRDDLILGFMGA